MNPREFLKGLGSAILSAAAAYVAMQWGAAEIPEPFKSLLALLAAALWNRYKPGAILLRYVRIG